MNGLALCAGHAGLESERCESQSTECRHSELEYDGSSRIPLFPPRPGEREEWSRVLEEVPAVEPAVCRVVNELAFRVDRLRGTGNGVHAVCAAVALVSLWLELVRG